MEVKKGVVFPLGPTLQKEGVNFAIHTKAEKVTLCLFDINNVSQSLLEAELAAPLHQTADVWHALVIGLPAQFAYAYRITPRDQKDTTHLILDPYAKEVISSGAWHDESGKEEYVPLGKFDENAFDWGDDAPPYTPMKELVIYEMHVRGFTRHPSSEVQAAGTYLGLIEKIPYLKDLGINAVELLPVHEFNEQEALQINPETQKKLHNYCGYSTVNFFSPMRRYASDGNQAAIEFKKMVKELHKNGIEVILDVVFNHTSEGNEKGPTQSFKGLDAKTYYMINEQGAYLNFSGCGNTFNCNHPITREFIIQALRYWVLEMHVDGFRFDLASIFNRAADGTPLDNAPLVEAIHEDPVLASRKLIAEAWDPGGLYQVGGFAAKNYRWSEWNGKYRDVARRFIKGTPKQKNIFAGVLSGTEDIYKGRAPTNTINFITCHDGFSLADLVSYNEKHNLANGEENRDGNNDNESWNCGFEGPTTNKKVVNLRKKQLRNLQLALMVSQGVPMLLMGDEYGHTKKGNNNTWCQDNELNWFLWDKLGEEKDFHRFYKLLIHFRKSHSHFMRDSFFSEKDVKWHGLNPDQPEWDNDNHFVAFSLHSPSEPDLYIAFNASHVYQTLTVPPLEPGKAYYWVVYTQNLPPRDFFEDSPKLEETTIKIAPYSSLMLKVL